MPKVTIKDLALEQIELSKLEKELKERKAQLREKFFALADENVPDYTLPTTSVHVPKSFFEKTGMDHDEFLKSRFPSWKITATSQTDNDFIFVLQKRKEYMAYIGADPDNGVQIARSISELTPEIDWDTMKKTDPDFFKAFAKEVITYELDTDVFQGLMAKDVSFDAQGFLVRHSKHKVPTLRVLAKELKDE